MNSTRRVRTKKLTRVVKRAFSNTRLLVDNYVSQLRVMEVKVNCDIMSTKGIRITASLIMPYAEHTSPRQITAHFRP